MRYPPCLDVEKGSEFACAECKVNCLARFCYIYIYIYIYIAGYFMFEITCLFYHFNTVRFPFETLSQTVALLEK